MKSISNPYSFALSDRSNKGIHTLKIGGKGPHLGTPPRLQYWLKKLLKLLCIGYLLFEIYVQEPKPSAMHLNSLLAVVSR